MEVIALYGADSIDTVAGWGAGLAGISAFGFSGTNIHMVLEQAPEFTAATGELERPCHLFTLSAQSPKALAELAARYGEYLGSAPDASIGEICFTANSGRARLSHRIALVASTIEELKTKLDQCDPLRAACSPVQSPQLTLLIQPEPLGDLHRQFYRQSPVFKAAIDACNAIALELRGVSIPPAVWTTEGPSGVAANELIAFALAYAMAVQWIDWGLNPSAIAGSGTGSYAAAVIAGAITLRDGLRLAFNHEASGIGQIVWTEPRIALVSARTGKPLTAASLNEPAEWTAAGLGGDVFHHGGKHVLLAIGSKPATVVDCIAVPASNWSELLGAIGHLFVAGIAVDWEKIESPWHRRRVALPSYPFQRQECWLKIGPAVSRLRSTRKEEHPLLGRRVYSARLSEEIVFESEFDLTALPFVQDHSFFGTPVFPGSAMLEMATAAGRLACRHDNVGVDNLVIEEPLLMPAGHSRLVQTVLTPAVGDGFSFTILSADAGELDGAPVWKRHCSGNLVRVESPAQEATRSVLEKLRALYTKPVDPEEFYAECLRLGLEYGPSFRLVRSILHGGDGLLARLEMPPDSARDTRFSIHPGLLDSVLQSIGILGSLVRDAKDPYLPVVIGSFRLYGSVPAELWCHSHFEAGPGDSPELVFGDARFYSSSGDLIGELLGVQFKKNSQREFSREMEERRLANWLFEPVWEPLPSLSRLADAGGTWVIISDGGPIAGELANELRSHRGLIVTADASIANSPESCDAFIEKVVAGCEVLRGVVLFAASISEGEIPEIASSATARLLNLTQALARRIAGELETFALVTQGFQSPGIGNPSSIGAAAAWGLGRTIAAELPGLHCKLIDLDPALSVEAAGALLADEVNSGSDENQVALSGGKRLALRLSQPGSSFLAAPANSISHEPVEMVFDSRGDFRQLRFAPQQLTAPGRGEVQLRVLATAMNFRDVLNVLGMYPGDPGPAGVECVGEIVALGEGVAGWNIGQRVLAMPNRGYCTFTNARADLMFACPPNLTLPEAATLLVGYLTAAYSLCDLGGMKAGDRVLIHAATGGVGLAAVQLAQRAGAEIFATAGSPAKREYLRQIGVRHIMDSRSLDFATEIRELTGGEGVDLVLNSLTGPALAEGLALLRPGGHFLEIGKNELLSAEQVTAINAGARYHVIDLREPFTHAPDAIRALFAGVTDSLASGVIRPLPYRTFDLADAPKAFRYMAAARHIGKVIVVDRSAAPTSLIEPGGTYLITGGLGGLGLQVARWMVGEGARNLVLVGRRSPNANAEAAIAEMAALGAKITAVQADVGDRGQVAAMLATHVSASAPLRGIIHAAGVLDDGVLLSQDWARFERVLRPKVAGAWNLHELTLGIPLDFFVLFASGAGLVGNAGQSNYSAANVFLDALAQARQAAGLTALSIDWGAWADAGMAAALDERHAKNWNSAGLTVIRPEQGLAILGRLLRKPQTAQMAVLPVADTAWRKPTGRAIAPMFRKLANEAGIKTDAAPANAVNAMERLREAGSDEKRTVLIELITEIVLDTFGLDRSRSIPADQNLTMLGMDSLLAIQLSNRLKTSFGAAVPSTLTFQYPTIEDIAGYLHETLSATEAPGAPAQERTSMPEGDQELDAEQAQKLLSNLDQLSDDEVEALLGAIEANPGAL